MPWQDAEPQRDYVDAVNGGRVHVGQACWVIGGHKAHAAVLRGVHVSEHIGTTAEVEFPGAAPGSVVGPLAAGMIRDAGLPETAGVEQSQIIAPAADDVVEAEIVDGAEIYPLPDRMFWSVDGGEIVANLAARGVENWPEIEYRTRPWGSHQEGAALTPAELVGLAKMVEQLREMGTRLEEGWPVTFLKPDLTDTDPPF